MDVRIDLKPQDCFLLALMCMVVPVKWLLAMVAAAAAHEASHLLAVIFCGGKVYSVRIGGTGAVMESAPMERWKELLCILAGPAGSFVLLFFSVWFPGTAVCGFVQGIYNLLPVYPLDGGRAVQCIASMFFPSTEDKAVSVAARITIILICSAGIVGTCVMKLGFLPLLASVLFAMKHLPGKIPCKDGLHRVQYRYHI